MRIVRFQRAVTHERSEAVKDHRRSPKERREAPLQETNQSPQEGKCSSAPLRRQGEQAQSQKVRYHDQNSRRDHGAWKRRLVAPAKRKPSPRQIAPPRQPP